MRGARRGRPDPPAATRRSWRCSVVLSACLGLATAAPAAAPVPAAQPGAPTTAFVAGLEARLPSWLQRYGVPGVAVSLVVDGKPVWSGAFGHADAATRRPLTTDAVFRVESISKSVTARGVMTLVEGGLVALDDPVQAHLRTWEPPVPEARRGAITVGRLLSGTAGLAPGRVGEEYEPGAPLPSLRRHLTEEFRLVAEPGVRFSYSNVGYALLELLVEDVTGRSFADYMRDEVLRPLGMGRATFDWSDVEPGALPTGHDLNGRAVPAYVYPALAAGGLYATVDDLARFVAAEVGAAAAGPVLELHVPRAEVRGAYGLVADGYAAGRFTEVLADGRTAVWHGGQGHGWMSHFHAVPAAGVGIVILTNSQRSWPLMAELLDLWAGWQGLGPLGMSKITSATRALTALTALLWLGTAWGAVRLVVDARAGRRGWRSLRGPGAAWRWGRLVVATVTLWGLAWAALQPYLMLQAVFPGAAGRAAWALAAGAVVIGATAIVPVSRREVARPAAAPATATSSTA